MPIINNGYGNYSMSIYVMLLPYRSIFVSTKYQTGHASVVTTFTIYMYSNCLICFAYTLQQLHFHPLLYKYPLKLSQVGSRKKIYYQSLTRLMSNKYNDTHVHRLFLKGYQLYFCIYFQHLCIQYLVKSWHNLKHVCNLERKYDVIQGGCD